MHFHMCVCVFYIPSTGEFHFKKIYVWKMYSIFGWIVLLWRKFNRYNKCIFFSRPAVVKWIDPHLSFVCRIWAHVLKQIIIEHAHNSNGVAKNNQYAHKSEINTCIDCICCCCCRHSRRRRCILSLSFDEHEFTWDLCQPLCVCISIIL